MNNLLRMLAKVNLSEQDIQSVIADLEDLDRCGVGGAFYLGTILHRSHVNVWSLGPWVIYQDKAGRWKYTPATAMG